MSAAPILQIDGMCVAFDHLRGRIRAVDDISFSLLRGGPPGLAGESKSTLALSILRMIKPPGHMEAGVVRFLGSSVGDLNEEGIRALRLAGSAFLSQGSRKS